MKKALIIDLDNTLYDYTAADRVAFKSLVESGARELDVSEDAFKGAYLKARDVVQERHRRRASSHNRMLYTQMTAEILGKSPLPVALTLYEVYWRTFFDSMQIFDGVVEALTELKKRGVKLSVCTDMLARVQFQKIRALGICEYFDAIVTSEEARAEKPSAVPVQILLDKLEMRTREVAFIGDGYEKDVLAAKYSGLTPIWFRGNEEKSDDVITVSSWRDSKLFEMF